MRKLKACIAFLGIALIVGYVITGSYGLSKRNANIHSKAILMQGDIDKLGFNNFHIKDYPVTFFDGKKDYVLYNGNIKEREPVLTTFAGTAYPVGNQYEILIPTIEKFSKMLSLIDISQNLANDKGYDDINHISTIWHEAFHAYQMSHYKKNIDHFFSIKSKLESLEGLIVTEVDNNIEVRKLLENELVILKKAVSSKNINSIKKYIQEYKAVNKERKKLLSNDINSIEKRYEILEGTAFYVESNAFRIVGEDEFYDDYYIDSIDKYKGGSSKYYSTGMAKCLLMDKLNFNWKENLDFTKDLDELLYKAIGE